MKTAFSYGLRAIALLLICSSYTQVEWNADPVTLSTPGAAASQQQMAMDVSGNLLAVWVEDGIVKSNSLPFGGSWGVSLDTLSGAGASDPKVILDSFGNATALWIEGGVVKVNAKPAAGGWGGAATVLSGMNASSPSLGVDQSGDVVALWLEGDVVKSSTKMYGGSWQSTVDTLSSSGASNPALGVGVGGQVGVVWQQEVASVMTVSCVSKAMGGLWTASQTISSSGVESAYPCVAADLNGNILAAWYSYTVQGNLFSNVSAQAAYLPLNGSWGTPYSFREAGINDPAALSMKIQFDLNNVGFLVWLNSLNASTFYVNTATFPASNVWTPLESIVANNMLTYSFDSTAFRSIGAVVWMGYDAYTNLIAIQSTGKSIGTTRASWAYASNVTEEGQIGYPIIAANRVGNQIYAASLWLRNNGANNVVQANICYTDAILPPSNLVVANQSTNYGVVTEYDNLITWSPSPFSDVMGYRIYRNNFLIAEVDAQTFQFLDVNQSPGLGSKYSLFAYNDLGDQSQEVSVTGP